MFSPRVRLREKTPPQGWYKDRPIPERDEGPAPKRHCRNERNKRTADASVKAQELTVNGILQLIWLFAVVLLAGLTRSFGYCAVAARILQSKQTAQGILRNAKRVLDFHDHSFAT
eukprot:symbB.v1.2.032768.t1/scaffold3977.1/size47023/3